MAPLTPSESAFLLLGPTGATARSSWSSWAARCSRAARCMANARRDAGGGNGGMPAAPGVRLEVNTSKNFMQTLSHRPQQTIEGANENINIFPWPRNAGRDATNTAAASMATTFGILSGLPNLITTYIAGANVNIYGHLVRRPSLTSSWARRAGAPSAQRQWRQKHPLPSAAS